MDQRVDKKKWVTSAKQPVKNKDIWVELERLSKIHKISWEWVRGHQGMQKTTLRPPGQHSCDKMT